MRAFLLVLSVPLLVPLPLLAFFTSGCDEAPRGEQGIDYLIDGSYYSAPSGHDAGTDARPLCQEEKDPSGICAGASSAGAPFAHLILCTGGHTPPEIMCVPGGDASADAGTFCCATGLL